MSSVERQKEQKTTAADGTASSSHSRDDSTSNDNDELETWELPFNTMTHEVMFVLTIMCGQIYTQASVAQANSILQIIGSHFGDEDPARRSWYVAAYSLTVGTFILTAGRLGDMYGHKKLLMIGYVWFSIWSLLAGIAHYATGSDFFIACRALQGVGPAILMPTCMAIIGTTYPEGKRRHMAFALYGSCAPGGYMLGSIFASLLAMRASWEWAYYITAIISAAMIPVVYFVVPSPKINEVHHHTSEGENQQEEETFDYFGAVTGVTGLILFNIAWNQAPIVGWDQPYVIILLILGILFFLAFCYIEARIAKHPLVPVFSGTIALVLGVVACGWSVFGIWIFNLWQFLEVLRGYTPLEVTAQMVPAPLVGFSAAILTGYLVRRVPTALIMMMALLVFTVSSILCATMPIKQTYWAQAFVTFLIAPIGMEFSFPGATILLSGAVPKRHQGIAASLVATVVNYSISIGLGIAGTVQAYLYQGTDPETLLKGYRSGFYLGIGIGGLGVILSLFSLYKETIIDKRRTRSTN